MFINKTITMRVSTEISLEERTKLKEFFRLYGTAQPLLNETGMHRITLNRLLRTGRATTETVEKVRAYVKRQEVLAKKKKSDE